MTDDLRSILAGIVGHEGVEAATAGDPLDALELVTADSAGWAHVAWLSAGEILVVSPSTLAMCLWPASTTTANLDRNGRALLQAVVAGAVVKLRLAVRPIGQLTVGDMVFAGFLGELVDRAGDAVGYADVLSGPTYRLHSAADVTERWRRQLAVLEAAAAAEVARGGTEPTDDPA